MGIRLWCFFSCIYVLHFCILHISIIFFMCEKMSRIWNCLCNPLITSTQKRSISSGSPIDLLPWYSDFPVWHFLIPGVLDVYGSRMYCPVPHNRQSGPSQAWVEPFVSNIIQMYTELNVAFFKFGFPNKTLVIGNRKQLILPNRILTRRHGYAGFFVHKLFSSDFFLSWFCLILHFCLRLSFFKYHIIAPISSAFDALRFFGVVQKHCILSIVIFSLKKSQISKSDNRNDNCLCCSRCFVVKSEGS